jgi:hypothetical protein
MVQGGDVTKLDGTGNIKATLEIKLINIIYKKIFILFNKIANQFKTENRTILDGNITLTVVLSS